jgi:rfaE bifunctional protein nucleotidyltransferase chain/domain
VTLIDTKIMPLDELATRVGELQESGRTVAHCHGVFDLLHPGHLRHFEEARAQADALIVTVTPDRFVNKGPGRPVFTERLRAESLAALEAVDYVAVNEWPTAIETIHLLKPDLYVKGPDYAHREDDVTGMILEEERAVVEEGGRLYVTDDLTYSSTALLNRHFEVFSPETEEFLSRFRERWSADDVIGALRSLATLRVAVVGDAIIDEYHFCRAYGMASKSASVASQILSEEAYAGGSFAIANHVAGFCEHVELVTCLGALESREDFVRAALKPNVTPTFLLRDDAPTTVKRRYVNSFLLMKMFEVARFSDAPLPPDVDAEFCRQLERLGDFDLVIVADFGQGLLGREAIETIVGRARFLAVNAQTNAINYGFNPVTRYPHADYVCVDQEEARLAYGDRRAPIDDVVSELARRLDARLVAVTRGQSGSLVTDREGRAASVPVFSREVVDTIGAGDAFLALTAPCAALGCDPELIGFVGNAVGALAVQIVGNKESVEPVPLFKFVSTLLK